MSFEDEWAQLKADAAMHLDRVPDPGPGPPTPQGDLQVNQKDLAAVGDVAFRLNQSLGNDGLHAMTGLYGASYALKTDFALGAALDQVAERWTEQVRSLQGACAHISNHLDYTQKAHAGDEFYLFTQFSNINTLDDGFREGDA
ncbi:glutathione S-transferase family protein [Streptomyces smaragdinus]|nr:hypothetical protein [Streptomyces smaragdinus]